MHIKILGSAAGGGFPQWNCDCANCSGLRAGSLRGKARTQAQVAISPDDSSWILLNASPDLRQQVVENREFAPAGAGRSTPISAIILTSADVDCVMGLLHLREFQPLRIYATSGVRRVLTEENSLFRTLERSHPPVQWESLPVNEVVSIFAQHASPKQTGICCRAVALDGDFPDYVSERLRASLPREEALVGLELEQKGKRMFYAPSIPGSSDGWKRYAAASDLSLLDGTFWTNDELVCVIGSGKTAREMGHMPLSETGGLLEQMGNVRGGRRILIHMNNTNPLLDEESEANRQASEGGWEIAHDGMEFEL
jgi:pyrroloquinoline quinone biosynthesis protein B